MSGLAGGFKTMLDTFDQTQLSRQKLGLLRDKFEVEKVGLLTAQEQASLELQTRKRALAEGQAIRAYNAIFGSDGIEGFIANATNAQDRNRRVFEANQFVHKYSKDLQFMGPDRQINGFERLVYPDASSFEQTTPADAWKNARWGISITGPDGKVGIATHGKGGRSANEKVMQYDEMGVTQVTRIIDDKMREISARPSATDEDRVADIYREVRLYFNKKGGSRARIENAAISIGGGKADPNDYLIPDPKVITDQKEAELGEDGTDESGGIVEDGTKIRPYLQTDVEQYVEAWLIGRGKWDGKGELPLGKLTPELREKVERSRLLKWHPYYDRGLADFYNDSADIDSKKLRRFADGVDPNADGGEADVDELEKSPGRFKRFTEGVNPNADGWVEVKATVTDDWNNKTVDIFHQAGDNNEYSWFHVIDENGDYIKNKDGEKAKFKAETDVLLNGRDASESMEREYIVESLTPTAAAGGPGGKEEKVKVEEHGKWDAIPKPGSVIYSGPAQQARQVAEGDETAALGTPYTTPNPPDINLYAGVGDPRGVNNIQQYDRESELFIPLDVPRPFYTVEELQHLRERMARRKEKQLDLLKQRYEERQQLLRRGLGAFTLPPGVRVEDALTPTDFTGSEMSIVEQRDGYSVNTNTEIIEEDLDSSTEDDSTKDINSKKLRRLTNQVTPNVKETAVDNPVTQPEQKTGMGSLAGGDGPYREVTASDLRAVNSVMGTGRTYADGFGRSVTVQPRATAQQIENILMTGSMDRTAERLYEAKAAQATKSIDTIKENINTARDMMGDILIDKYGEDVKFADKKARVSASFNNALRVSLNNRTFQKLVESDSFGGLTIDIARNFVDMTEDINAWERGGSLGDWFSTIVDSIPFATPAASKIRSWFRETVENQQTLFFAANALQLQRYGIENREYIAKIIAPTITFRDQPGKTGFNDRAHIPDLINIFSNPSLVQELIKDTRVSGATEKEKIINLATQFLMGAN